MDCSDVGFLSVFRFFIAHVVAARKIDEVKCEKMICGLRVLGQEIVGSWKYYWVYGKKIKTGVYSFPSGHTSVPVPSL